MEKEIYDAMSRNLKLLRKYLNLNQYDMSSIMECSRPTYSGYERGYRIPGIEELYYLAKEYNLKIDYFFIENPSEFLRIVKRSIKKDIK